MTDEFEKKWQNSQIAGWRNDENKILVFFQRFGLNISDIYGHIMEKLQYDKMQIIFKLLFEIEKAVAICDYLDSIKEEARYDVDVIKLFFLISHAEIAMHSLGCTGRKQDLVNKFFRPVEQELKYKIQLCLDSITKLGDIQSAEILYKIRCQYAHEGDSSGIIFQKNDDGAGNYFCVKDNTTNLMIFGTCNLTCREFMNIYMEALVENIKIFSEFVAGSNPKRN